MQIIGIGYFSCNVIEPIYQTNETDKLLISHVFINQFYTIQMMTKNKHRTDEDEQQQHHVQETKFIIDPSNGELQGPHK